MQDRFELDGSFHIRSVYRIGQTGVRSSRSDRSRRIRGRGGRRGACLETFDRSGAASAVARGVASCPALRGGCSESVAKELQEVVTSANDAPFLGRLHQTS